MLGDSVECDAGMLMGMLAEKGIGSRPFFWCMHERPVFRRMGLFDDVSCPNAERIARRGMYVPSGASLTDDQIEEVCGVLREILASHK